MANTLVYLVGRDTDINQSMSIKAGTIVIHIPNYTKVLEAPVKPDARDEYCYALLVREDQVERLVEDPREGEILRLWSGPKGNRGFATHTIQAEIYPLNDPLKGQADDMLEVIKEKSDKVAELETDLETLKKFNDQLIGERDEARMKVNELTTQVDNLTSEVAKLRADLVKATSSTQIVEVTDRVLAEVIAKAPAEVLEAPPHIGPENKENVLKWAHEVLNSEG